MKLLTNSLSCEFPILLCSLALESLFGYLKKIQEYWYCHSVRVFLWVDWISIIWLFWILNLVIHLTPLLAVRFWRFILFLWLGHVFSLFSVTCTFVFGVVYLKNTCLCIFIFLCTREDLYSHPQCRFWNPLKFSQGHIFHACCVQPRQNFAGLFLSL